MATPGVGAGPDQIPDGWNATAARYDEAVWDLMTPYVGAAIQAAELSAEHELLDVAAGSGRVTVEVAPLVKRVLSVDFAAEMLALLRARIEAERFGNVEVAHMDGQNLEIADASFDRVLSNFGIIFFPDQAKGFAEMHRVLRPGGRAVVTTWTEQFDAFRLFGMGLRAAIPDLPLPPKPQIFSLGDVDHLAALIRGAGFSDVRVDTVVFDYEAGTPDEFWDLMSRSAPPAVAILKMLDADQVERVRKSVLETVVAEKGSELVVLSGEARVAVAIK